MIPLATLIQENSPDVQEKKLINGFRAFAQRKNLFEIEINTHIAWILRFIRFHNKQHPTDLSQSDIELFISSLAIEQNYDKRIQSNAANALMFLYRDFLQIDIAKLQYAQLKTRRGFIDRYTKDRCESVLKHLTGTSRLMAELALYCRLKLNQVIGLKLTDIDMKKNRIKVRDKAGNMKFILNIPIHLILDLRIQMMRVRQLIQIKTRQFSMCYQKDVSKLSSKVRQPSLNIQDEYLFPISNTENPHISSRNMQLALLKSDIQTAINRYLRFCGDSANRQSSEIKPIQIATKLTRKGMSIRDQHTPIFDTKAQKLVTFKTSAENLQSAFNFDSNPKQSHRARSNLVAL